MTQPLALVFYERLLPGTQLVNRLQDLNYRVETVHDAAALVTSAKKSGALVVFADLESTQSNLCEVIALLKENPATKHLPVVAFAHEQRGELQAAARAVGAVAVSETALLSQLPQLIDQVLQLD